MDLFRSFDDISLLKLSQDAVAIGQRRPYKDIHFIIHGGSAFAEHTGNTRTKDFDVLVVASDMRNLLASYWNAMMWPFFQHLKYEVLAFAPSPQYPVLKNFAKRYGAIAAINLRGPEGNVIDLGFVDFDLIGADNWKKTSTWFRPIQGSPLYVLTTERLSANLAEKLANQQTPEVRRVAMERLGVLVPLIQRAVDAAKNLESPNSDAHEQISKRIGKKLAETPIGVSGWRHGWKADGARFGTPMKMYELILTALALSSKTLRDHGVDMVLKGGTVSTQYIGALETDDIDVEVFRKEPAVGFVPRPLLHANAPGKNVAKQNMENWSRYFGPDSMQYIIGFLVYLVRLLRTMDGAAIGKLVEDAINDWRVVRLGFRDRKIVSKIDYGLRAKRMQSNRIVLVSVDMIVYVKDVAGDVTEFSNPLFDCVFGDVHDFHASTGIDERFMRNDPSVGLRMQNSATIDADMIDMVEHKLYKREKRLLRFLKKKAAGNTISQNLRNHVRRAAPEIRLLPVNLRRWKKIQDEYVPQTERRAAGFRFGIADLLRSTEGAAGNATTNANWGRDAVMNNNNDNRMNVNVNHMNINKTPSPVSRKRRGATPMQMG